MWRAIQINLKRAVDIILAGMLLIICAPLIGLLALLVVLDSSGPAIYKHVRIGKDGKPFYLYKFRSMITGGDDAGYMQYLKELIESDLGGHNGKVYSKLNGDPRITRVGAFLRKYYLDELPQFYNVLKGEMSLVGPRPHVQFEVDYYSEDQCRRLSVRPGVTGLWQVAGKADCTFSELIALDLEYIDRLSFALDIQIILKTLLLMVRGGEGFWARMTKYIPRSKTRRNGNGNTNKPAEAVENAAGELDKTKLPTLAVHDKEG
jgi:lipopolysaccharide/colanic/teichoic acid biosynthesis glycosyltransferase